MRKTWPHNPRGFERSTWNYRVLQLRHALGWRQKRLSKVSGIPMTTISHIETGAQVRPALDTIARIKNMENIYADILEIYKKAPVRNNRLHPDKTRKRGRGVYLLPITIRRPEDIESLGKVEANSDAMYFGRKSRKRMRQAGVPLSRQIYFARRTAAITRGMRKKIATGWSAVQARKDSQLRQSNDKGEGKG